MTRNKESQSPRPEEVTDHYASGYEASRLETGQGKIDRERSRELLTRFLPSPPATILDIGGGPGGHACWLSRRGYDELKSEVSEAGFSVRGVFGVEGPSWLAPDLDDWWSNEVQRNELLRIARALESEPTLLGISAHLIVVGKKQ